MNLGDFGRALGYGTIGGLGTAEEKRQREMKMLEVGMNLALRREALKHQQEQLAESRRQHDLPYGEMDYTPYINIHRERLGEPLLPPGTIKGPRNMAQSVVSGYSAATKPQTVTLEDLQTMAQGVGVKVPETPFTRPVPIAAPPSEESVAASGNLESIDVRDVARERAAMGTKIPLALAQSLIGHAPKRPTLHEQWERRKLDLAETKEIDRQRQINEARAVYVETGDLNKALAGRPLVKADDVYKHVPPAPKSLKELEEEAAARARGTQSVKPPSTPAEKELEEIKLERARFARDRDKERADTKSLLERVSTGKATDPEKRKAISELQGQAKRWADAAEKAREREDAANAALYSQWAAEDYAMAGQIRRILTGSTPVPGEKPKTANEFYKSKGW